MLSIDFDQWELLPVTQTSSTSIEMTFGDHEVAMASRVLKRIPELCSDFLIRGKLSVSRVGLSNVWRPNLA